MIVLHGMFSGFLAAAIFLDVIGLKVEATAVACIAGAGFLGIIAWRHR